MIKDTSRSWISKSKHDFLNQRSSICQVDVRAIVLASVAIWAGSFSATYGTLPSPDGHCPDSKFLQALPFSAKPATLRQFRQSTGAGHMYSRKPARSAPKKAQWMMMLTAKASPHVITKDGKKLAFAARKTPSRALLIRRQRSRWPVKPWAQIARSRLRTPNRMARRLSADSDSFHPQRSPP